MYVGDYIIKVQLRDDADFEKEIEVTKSLKSIHNTKTNRSRDYLWQKVYCI